MAENYSKYFHGNQPLGVAFLKFCSVIRDSLKGLVQFADLTPYFLSGTKARVKLLFQSALIVLLLSPSSVLGQTTVDTSLRISPVSFTLENGLQVLLIEDHRAPVAIQMVFYKVGNIDEPEGKGGLAHFLEHLMFKGTASYPDGAFSKKVGEIGGEENAFTSNDVTAYFQMIGKAYLPLVMELESDRMRNLELIEDHVASERGVIREERRTRVEADVNAQFFEQFTKKLFEGHPYGRPLSGESDEIMGLTLEDVVGFYNQYYRPDNAVLVIAGDIDENKVRADVDKFYGKIANPDVEKVRKTYPVPELTQEKRISLADKNATNELLFMSTLVPPKNATDSNDEAVFRVMMDILGSENGRLSRALTEQTQTAAFANGHYDDHLSNSGSLAFLGVPFPGKSFEDLEKGILEQIKLLATQSVDEDELSRSKLRLTADYIYQKDTLHEMIMLVGSAVSQGMSVERQLNLPNALLNVSADQVQKAAQQYLENAKFVVGTIKPSN